MLRERVISAIFLIALLVVFIFWGSWPFLFLLIIINMLAMYEYNRLTFAGDRKNLFLLLVFSITLILYTYLTNIGYLKGPDSVFIFLFFILFLITHFFVTGKGFLQQISYNLFGILYIGTSLLFFILLRDFSIEPFQGTRALWLALLATWASDTGAYFTGLKLGRHKLAASISPGKTIEGALGGIMLTVIVVSVLTILYGVFNFYWVGYGVMVAVIAIIGDLFESRIKRDLGVKDSGRIIPGHGGVLDRLDSLFFTAPFTYFFLLTILNYG